MALMNFPFAVNNILFWPLTDPLLYNLFEIYLKPDDSTELRLHEWQNQWDERTNNFSKLFSEELSQTKNDHNEFLGQFFNYMKQLFFQAIEYFKVELNNSNKAQLMAINLLNIWFQCCEKAYQELLWNTAYQKFFGDSINNWVHCHKSLKNNA